MITVEEARKITEASNYCKLEYEEIERKLRSVANAGAYNLETNYISENTIRKLTDAGFTVVKRYIRNAEFIESCNYDIRW